MSQKQKSGHLSLKWIIGILLFSITILLYSNSYFSARNLAGTGGIAHILGNFLSDDGNAGTLSFGAVPSDGYSGGHLAIPPNGEQFLTGSFWAETVGWINMHDITFSLTNTGQSIWSLSGYAWNDQIGWIDFSRVTYSLSNTSFSGYAWNDGIGWINMNGATLDLTSSGSIGKVKVIGNLGGDRIFNTQYTLENRITGASITQVMNSIRKNVAILTRNLPLSRINMTLDSNRQFSTPSGAVNSQNTLLFQNTGSTVARVSYTENVKARFENIGNSQSRVNSIIAIGADIYIDDAVIPQTEDNRPRLILALKNSEGVGGNIYINGTITRIRSSLVAEGSLYSGEWSGTGNIIYNSSAADLFRIPNRQLYVYGTVLSNNTIGGYIADNNTANFCPYNITPCNDETALTHDFNHFRDFAEGAPEGQKAVLRGYKDSSLDAYSIIIEFDSRIFDAPPPGFEQILQ